MRKKYYKTQNCLNCDYPVNNANYCSQCGQINSEKRQPFNRLVKDFLGEYFTFDSRFFESFIPLIAKPGHLTKEYNTGKRASYVLPLRLYMFTTFLFFLIITLQNKITGPNFEEKKQESIEAMDSLKAVIDQFNIADDQKLIEKIDSTFILKIKSKKPRVLINGQPADSIKEGFSKYIADKIVDIGRRGNEGWQLLWMEVLNQLPKMMFLLLPVFALLLKLIYIRRKVLYINHLIFSLHAHTVIFIYMIFANLIPTWYVITAIIIGSWFHLFFAIRKVYQQSKWKTFLKLNILLFSYNIVLVFAVMSLVVLAIITI